MANVGDRVQIRNGAIDVTNGNRAKAGKKYGEGGPLWATVVLIDPSWKTGSRWGLPSVVTKVRCQSDTGVVVWQVQPEDIVSQVIQASQPNLVQKTNEAVRTSNMPVIVPEPDPPVVSDIGLSKLGSPVSKKYDNEDRTSIRPYAIEESSEVWDTGVDIYVRVPEELPGTAPVSTKVVPGSSFGSNEPISYEKAKGSSIRNLTNDERKTIGSNNVMVDDRIVGYKQQRAWDNPSKRAQMLNEDKGNIQNSYGFPLYDTPSSGYLAAKYDYRILPNYHDENKKITLEDKLTQLRASLGIQVHGNNNIARAVKYYMYNRFKTPDTNLAHNKTVTHVFFTRPDLNLLDCTSISSPKPNSQILNHTDAVMVWKRYPELFKLLTDRKRCGDSNNFNFLLSNQVTSFDIEDIVLNTNDVGKTWGEYSIGYGENISNKGGGEFTCNFTETSDYSVMNLLRLWIIYIDNVSRGAWSPSYNLFGDGRAVSNPEISYSHVFTKTLDYGASVYIFKCGPDGSDVIYWSKYYGVFPINAGINSLSWDNKSPIGDCPNLSIRFKYSLRRDFSPISLIELNHIAGITEDTAIYERSFNPNYNHSSRPYVGAPFIELDLANPILRSNGVAYDNERTSIRLRFQPSSDDKLTDDLLYRYSMGGRKIDVNDRPNIAIANTSYSARYNRWSGSNGYRPSLKEIKK